VPARQVARVGFGPHAVVEQSTEHSTNAQRFRMAVASA
jgi:hypothetical protein